MLGGRVGCGKSTGPAEVFHVSSIRGRLWRHLRRRSTRSATRNPNTSAAIGAGLRFTWPHSTDVISDSPWTGSLSTTGGLIGGGPGGDGGLGGSGGLGGG